MSTFTQSKESNIRNKICIPKFVMYNSTGEGRDSYIKFDNGGFFKSGFGNVAVTNFFGNNNSPKYTFYNHQ